MRSSRGKIVLDGSAAGTEPGVVCGTLESDGTSVKISGFNEAVLLLEDLCARDYNPFSFSVYLAIHPLVGAGRHSVSSGK